MRSSLIAPHWSRKCFNVLKKILHVFYSNPLFGANLISLQMNLRPRIPRWITVPKIRVTLLHTFLSGLVCCLRLYSYISGSISYYLSEAFKLISITDSHISFPVTHHVIITYNWTFNLWSLMSQMNICSSGLSIALHEWITDIYPPQQSMNVSQKWLKQKYSLQWTILKSALVFPDMTLCHVWLPGT